MDRRMDTGRQQRPHLHIASRGKNFKNHKVSFETFLGEAENTCDKFIHDNVPNFYNK